MSEDKVILTRNGEYGEYAKSTYEQMSDEFRQLYPQVKRAFKLVGMMYDRLTLVDGFTHKKALQKIMEDHADLEGFSARNVRR